MAEENRGQRETAFRRANRRRMMAGKLFKVSAVGACLALTAVWVGRAPLNSGAAQGTFDQPYQVEPLKEEDEEDRDEEKGPEEDEETDFEYIGELEVAAYSSDGRTFTYSGEEPEEGHTAAGALSMFNLRDRVLIDGKQYVIEDRVDENASEKLRIYFGSHDEAMLYGRKTVVVYRARSESEKGDGYIGEFEVTAYCSCELCCGPKSKGLTKMETVPKAGYTIAVDPSVIPLGTYLVIDGVTYMAEDTGEAIKGSRLDIYFDSHEEAVRYGRKEKSVYLADTYNPL